MTDREVLQRFRDIGVLVLGDYMLDEYLVGRVSRISPEAPVPIMHLEREEHALGGAGNVAANLRALECKVHACGVVGDDAAGRRVRTLIESIGADDSGLIIDITRPTIQKVRLVADRHQLVRYDRERAEPIDSATELRLWGHIEASWASYDVVILSDYAKGTLSPSLISKVVQAAQRSGKRVIVDPKGTSYQKYLGAAVLTPNEAEALHAAGRQRGTVDDLVEIGRNMVREFELEAFCITRGAEGVLLIEASGAVYSPPTNARAVFDVTGAGDTFIATFVAAATVGASLCDAARLANQAAGIAVGKIGTTTVSLVELLHALSGNQKICTVDEIAGIASRLRQIGKRVVFTNGCFDLLHVGHVRYLEQARALGDALILGLNSDASVRRLKGASRPLIGESERAQIMAALRAVDYVTLFDEDMPLRLIEAVRPDVLTKGADYQREEVVGYDLVESWGGKVELIDLVEGSSTSKIIERIVKRHSSAGGHVS